MVACGLVLNQKGQILSLTIEWAQKGKSYPKTSLAHEVLQHNLRASVFRIYTYISTYIPTYIHTYITYIFGQYIELTKNSFEFLCDSIRKNTNELAGQLNK